MAASDVGNAALSACIFPPQDEAHPAPCVWLQELRKLPPACHRTVRL